MKISLTRVSTTVALLIGASMTGCTIEESTGDGGVTNYPDGGQSGDTGTAGETSVNTPDGTTVVPEASPDVVVDAAFSCTAPSGAGACELCAYRSCCPALAACAADKVGCTGSAASDPTRKNLGVYFSCVNGSDSGSAGACAETFIQESNEVMPNKANDLIDCLSATGDAGLKTCEECHID